MWCRSRLRWTLARGRTRTLFHTESSDWRYRIEIRNTTLQDMNYWRRTLVSFDHGLWICYDRYSGVSRVVGSIGSLVSWLAPNNAAFDALRERESGGLTSNTSSPPKPINHAPEVQLRAFANISNFSTKLHIFQAKMKKITVCMKTAWGCSHKRKMRENIEGTQRREMRKSFKVMIF